MVFSSGEDWEEEVRVFENSRVVFPKYPLSRTAGPWLQGLRSWHRSRSSNLASLGVLVSLGQLKRTVVAHDSGHGVPPTLWTCASLLCWDAVASSFLKGCVRWPARSSGGGQGSNSSRRSCFTRSQEKLRRGLPSSIFVCADFDLM